MDWTLSREAKRYIENSVIGTTPACDAKDNSDTIDAIVEELGGEARYNGRRLEHGLRRVPDA